MHKKHDLDLYKRQHMNMAISLCYRRSVIERIRNAKSEDEITHIMYDARISWDEGQQNVCYKVKK